MPYVERWTPGAPVNEDGSHAGSWVEYVPDSIDSQLTDQYTGVSVDPREAAHRLLMGAGMQPGSYNNGAGVGKAAIDQLYASDPRFAQFFPDKNAIYNEVQGLMGRQAGIDAAASNQFDFGKTLLGGAAAGIGALSGGFGLGSLFNGGGSGGGMWDWFRNMFGGGTVSPSADWANSWGDIGGLPNVNTSLSTSGVNLNDYYNSLNDAQSATNGVTAPSPSMSIPGYGDVYGSNASIIKSLLDRNGLGSLLTGPVSGGLGSIFGGNTGGSLLGAGLGGLLGSMNGAKKIDDAVTSEYSSNPFLSPLATNEMAKTIRGDYLNPDSNPYLKQTYDRAAGEIGARLSPSFGHMEAFGQNSGWQNAYGRSLADLGTSLYGGNYNQERNRQYGAMGSVPFGNTKFSSTPVYSNPMGGIMSGAMAGGLLGGKLFNF